MAVPLLTVTGLTIAFTNGSSAHMALRDVDFSLDEGFILGIIGESGAGKTSLALALMGLLEPGAARVSGSVVYRGDDLTLLSDKEMSRFRGGEIGMIFQDPQGSLDPVARVHDQVAESIRRHQGLGKREARQKALAQLELYGVDRELLASAPYAHQLSGGLCQRAMIAAAMAPGPGLLIADEPTSALDMTTQAQIISLLREARDQTGMAMVFISHDLALVSSLADQVMVLRQGEVVEHGDRATVIRQPAHEYTAGLIEAGAAMARGGGMDAATTGA